jgi:DNA-binding IclR family transcriptional regulator
MRPQSPIKSIRAVERAADVLMCFSRASPTLSVTDLQKRLSLSRPTLYRVLHALERKGLVRSFGEPQRFELGHRVVGLADAWAAKCDAATAAAPYLKELWIATDETVSLFVLASPTTKVCVQELPSRQPLVFTRGAGFTEPTTTGASGKSILAFMVPAEIEVVLAAAAKPEARSALVNELRRIRAAGHCVSEGEIIAGAVAIAAPVFDRTGRVAGSVCLFGPEARLSGRHRATCLASVRATAARVSAALGYAPGTHAAAE